jgi:hypothetical protein
MPIPHKVQCVTLDSHQPPLWISQLPRELLLCENDSQLGACVGTVVAHTYICLFSERASACVLGGSGCQGC